MASHGGKTMSRGSQLLHLQFCWVMEKLWPPVEIVSDCHNVHVAKDSFCKWTYKIDSYLVPDIFLGWGEVQVTAWSSCV